VEFRGVVSSGLRVIPERLLRVVPEAEQALRAPGRANLIGEHTDYNDGFVLPVALELAVYVAGRRRGGVLSLRSLDEPGGVEVDVGTGEGSWEGWGVYAAAVVRALLDDGVEVEAFEGVVASDVPVGAGLSSSAALEVAVARAAAGAPLDPARLAAICQRAENVYVGTRSGILDQFASAAGRADHALLIDCRDLTVAPVPFPASVAVLIVDSGVRRDLTESAYNERVAECAAAAEALGVRSLREATWEDLERAQGELNDVLFRRARHVLEENARVLAAADALRSGRLDELGPLFRASHKSLARDYEVSTPELDALVGIAEATDGVIGARLTGAGFGGCTVNLARADAAEAAGRAVVERYRTEMRLEARFWVSRPAEGAGPVRVEVDPGSTPSSASKSSKLSSR
jgi:galactokinase